MPDARPVGETAAHGGCICCDRVESVADQLGVNVRGLGGGNLDAWLCDDCDRAIRCEGTRAAPREPGEAERLIAGWYAAWVAEAQAWRDRQDAMDAPSQHEADRAHDRARALLLSAEIAMAHFVGAAPRPDAGDGTGEPC